jgi:hypothetical protein
MGSLLTLMYAEHNNSSSLIDNFLSLLGIFFTLFAARDGPDTITCGATAATCDASFSGCGVGKKHPCTHTLHGWQMTHESIKQNTCRLPHITSVSWLRSSKISMHGV